MTNYFFFYGTLMSGFVPQEMQGVVRQFATVGPGFVAGRLYDLGDYPGAVLDEAGDSTISGQVFKMPDDEPRQRQLLNKLDTYEGYTLEDEAQCLFVRRRARVTLLNDESLECWIYVYNGDTRGAALIPSGNYAKRKRPGESA